ncbi:hypothetical protein C8J57DRAFT_1239241 [Mycena rebaudengoi]|nr:hypothetical protein C8J57DRAFT_1239241 [Mycena rebaudengoi]
MRSEMRIWRREGVVNTSRTTFWERHLKHCLDYETFIGVQFCGGNSGKLPPGQSEVAGPERPTKQPSLRKIQSDGERLCVLEGHSYSSPERRVFKRNFSPSPADVRKERRRPGTQEIWTLWIFREDMEKDLWREFRVKDREVSAEIWMAERLASDADA